MVSLHPETVDPSKKDKFTNTELQVATTNMRGKFMATTTAIYLVSIECNFLCLVND